jgi:hypothetical protein
MTLLINGLNFKIRSIALLIQANPAEWQTKILKGLDKSYKKKKVFLE